MINTEAWIALCVRERGVEIVAPGWDADRGRRISPESLWLQMVSTELFASLPSADLRIESSIL